MISIVFCFVYMFMIYVPFRVLLLKRFKKMKRFRLLSTLFIWLIWLVWFWYCWFLITNRGDSMTQIQIPWNWEVLVEDVCISFSNSNCFPNLKIYNSNGDLIWSNFPSFNTSDVWICFIWWQYRVVNAKLWSCYMNSWKYTDYWFCSCPTCEEQYTSEECQQEYSLMPISSCNSEYCWLNWLCPEYTWSTISELYINWINHLWAPIINLVFPLEQAWDYSYTWDIMNINLSWENNVDYEYMDNIIRTQNSKPNTTDLNNIVSVLLPKFVPWLVIILFILFVFRFIKKIF